MLIFLKFTHLGRGIYCNKRYGAQCVLQPHQHHTLINQSDPNNRGLQLARNNYSYSLEVRTIVLARPVVGITTTTDLSITRSPHL